MQKLKKEAVLIKDSGNYSFLPLEDCNDSIEYSKNKTMASKILTNHNVGDENDLKIKFDKLISHDITYVGIIQTARASGLDKFPIPYVLTNCHNSLCAVGGTINEDDHVFGLSAAKKYGGIFVPPHQAVIHQYAREEMAEVGSMILGSDSHTRYGALGCMAVGEGGPELVKQLLEQTYDIKKPKVIAIYLENELQAGVGPQDVALAIIGEVFSDGFVNNCIMEFLGPGVKKLSADYRIGIDVMTTETTCLSSIWETDEVIKEFYEIHGRLSAYKEIKAENGAVYDGVLQVDLSKIKPMIALPFHPSYVYTIDELKANPVDILTECENKAKLALNKEDFKLTYKIINNEIYVDQGIIAGCAGGGFENICEAAHILKGHSIGNDEFSLSVYAASTPIYMELMKNGAFVDLMNSGAIIKTAFCGPCFGAGDTPANNAFSIRHTTRNFPNREGSKLQSGQISSVALMDARSIAATAYNKGKLTSATDIVDREYKSPKYYFDKTIYENRVYNGWERAKLDENLVFGPNIKDWPEQVELQDNILLKVVSYITDPVTTTDELIPSGETSSYRSNPIGLAEYTLSRKDPQYVGRAKEIKELYRYLLDNKLTKNNSLPDNIDEKNLSNGAVNEYKALKRAWDISRKISNNEKEIEVGSTIFAIKPGDGSAREQAASCQRVLGGLANIASEYATKRYRSNLINWGMLPFLIENRESLELGAYVFVPNIKEAVLEGKEEITAYVIKDNGNTEEISLKTGSITKEEKEIITKGCLINYNKK